MLCPSCNYPDSRVLESRSAESGRSIRRRRECLRCQRRFTTYERIEFVPITVIKRDGTPESFDRSKLLRGMVRACEKTGIAQEKLDAGIDDIESQLQTRSDHNIPSVEIGELVLEFLQTVSEVAYVRFASVYRQFQGVRDFAEALRQLDQNLDQDQSETRLEEGLAETFITDTSPIIP
jgi:transcriptional repressor NrdR